MLLLLGEVLFLVSTLILLLGCRGNLLWWLEGEYLFFGVLRLLWLSNISVSILLACVWERVWEDGIRSHTSASIRQIHNFAIQLSTAEICCVAFAICAHFWRPMSRRRVDGAIVLNTAGQHVDCTTRCGASRSLDGEHNSICFCNCLSLV